MELNEIKPLCQSCGFPAGPRCGYIHAYRLPNGQAIELCDDCVTHAGDVGLILHESE